MKKTTHKKVTYTFEKSIIDVIQKRSMIENISKSKLLSFYIQSGYGLMVDEYYESNQQPIKTIRKRKNTIPQTFTISTDILDVIDFFSKKLDVKKSHLVMSCVVNFEREFKRKEDERLSQQIDDLMKIVDESYHIK